MILDGLESPLALTPQVMDLFIQCLDHVGRSVDRGPELAPFSLPAADAFVLSTSAALLGIDLVAKLTLLRVGNGVHNKLHAAGFTCTVFPVAVLSEMAPFPVATGKSVHVEETHVWTKSFFFILAISSTEERSSCNSRVLVRFQGSFSTRSCLRRTVCFEACILQLL